MGQAEVDPLPPVDVPEVTGLADRRLTATVGSATFANH